MTLDIAKFIANSIRTQAKIQHLDVATKATSVDDVPESVKSLISKQYGAKYLNDADYVAFFWGGLGKEEIAKLFNVVDKALGKSANKLTETDFKKIIVNDDGEDDITEPEETAEDTETDGDEEEDIDVTVDVDDNGNSDGGAKDDSDQLDEDDEIDTSMSTETPKKTSHFFLKITVK